MSRKSKKAKLYQLLTSKRMRDKMHPKVKRDDRVDAEGNRKRIRPDEFTEDGFPWGGGNMGELL